MAPSAVVTEAAMMALLRDGVDLLTDDALGRPSSRFDDGKRHAVVGYDPAVSVTPVPSSPRATGGTPGTDCG